MGSRSRGSDAGGLALFFVMTRPNCMINTGHERVGREWAGRAEFFQAGKIGGDVLAVDQMVNSETSGTGFDPLVAHEPGERRLQLGQGSRTSDGGARLQ